MTVAFGFNTPDRIIRFAMINAGKLARGDDPGSDDYAEYMPRLNDLFNIYQTKGIKLWLNYDLAVPLVEGQATYTLGPSGTVNMTKPMRVIAGYYLDVTNTRRPLTPLSWDEYKRLSNITDNSAINSYFTDKQQLQLAVSFWPPPDAVAATGTAHLIIQQQVANVVQINDSMNFPQEWFVALHWGLSDEISTGQPKEVQDRCQLRAAAFLEALENWDVEDPPTMFQPDPRVGVAGRFK